MLGSATVCTLLQSGVINDGKRKKRESDPISVPRSTFNKTSQELISISIPGVRDEEEE